MTGTLATAVDVALRGGATVRVRPVRPEDEAGLAAFLRALSPGARQFRFFGTANLDRAARDAAHPGEGDYGLVALTGDPPRVVGHALFARTGEERAEVAFAIADELQGQGLATLLLAHLAERADAQGIKLFEAEVLPANRRMVEVFRESGFPAALAMRDGVLHVELPTSPSVRTIESFEARDRIASAAAARVFLRPAAVAVVGASRERGTPGAEVLHNLRAGGYRGTLYAVNRAGGEVQGLPALASAAELPPGVDLAVLAVPAGEVVGAARACGERGVKALVVLSAGFAETGAAGARRQRELLDACRQTGMRLVGPNCLGVLNTAPDVRLDATFATELPPAGGVSLLSQSGGLGIALLEESHARGLGMASFVSVGNKADISGNDLLQYWEDDGATRVVLLYLESFGNPRKFARVARRVSHRKPIVVVKSGRGRAGARAAASHTGAMLAASDVTVDALFAQTGVIRTDTLAELFEVATLLAEAPLPAGDRVAIVTNAGGPGIMCADACEAGGLDVVELSPRLRARLAALAAREAALGNPVDLLADPTPEQYAGVLEEVATSGEVDAVIAIFIRPIARPGGDAVAAAIRAAAARLGPRLPVLPVLMSAGDRAGTKGSPLVFRFPEDAARALAHAARHAAWRRRPAGRVPDLPDVASQRAAALFAGVAAAGPRWLEPGEVAELLDCYGVPTVETRFAVDADAAEEAAAELGGPVALKAVVPGLHHRRDLGGVRLGLEGRAAVAGAARQMRERLAAAGHPVAGFEVQPFVPDAVDVLVGAVADPRFGPVVACGPSGRLAGLQQDAAVRLTPLTDLDAREMLRSLRSFPVLAGDGRGRGVAVAALEELLLRIAALAEVHPQVLELDCHPVLVNPAGALVLDARVRAGPVPAAQPWPSLGAAAPAVR
jgi:acyl-CoA synthetase (NDP forming)/GNAT superfamily N-acetyltransferase